MSESTALIQHGPAGAINAFHSEASFVSAQRMAKALASSSLVPDSYRNNVADCLIAIELANRTGASVPMVMQNLDIIHGRPSWRSTFLIATVNACGRFTPLRFRFQGTEGKDDWGCRAVARDKADGEECVGPLVTISMAKAEGWHGKKGSKWQTLPELMLTYRAATFWTRTFAPELSLGMMTTDEAELLPPPARVHAQSVAAALHAEDDVQEAELVEDEVQHPTPAELKERVEQKKNRDLHAAYFARFNEVFPDAGEHDRHALQQRVVGKASTTEFTAEDYRACLRELDEVAAQMQEVG